MRLCVGHSISKHLLIFGNVGLGFGEKVWCATVVFIEIIDLDREQYQRKLVPKLYLLLFLLYLFVKKTLEFTHSFCFLCTHRKFKIYT